MNFPDASADFGGYAEEVVPGNFALTDIEVLMHAGIGALRIEYVSQAGTGLMIERVTHMNICIPGYASGLKLRTNASWVSILPAPIRSRQ